MHINNIHLPSLLPKHSVKREIETVLVQYWRKLSGGSRGGDPGVQRNHPFAGVLHNYMYEGFIVLCMLFPYLYLPRIVVRMHILSL